MALYRIARASTAVAILVVCGFASPAARADTVQTFTLENTTDTEADDVTVYFKQPITKYGKNETSTGDSFAAPVYASPPSKYGLAYGPPLMGGTTIGMGDTFKFTVTTSAGSLQVDKSTNLTYFTNNKAKINNSVKQVSANIDLSTTGGTTVVTLSNPTTDVYEFLTNIEIWTGLSESAAENYALNWTAPGTTPNFTPADINLAPGATDSIPIGAEGGNYDLIIYDFAFGSSASSDLATSVGIMTFAGTAPEAPTWVMLLLGFGGLGAATCLVRRRIRPAILPA